MVAIPSGTCLVSCPWISRASTLFSLLSPAGRYSRCFASQTAAWKQARMVSSGDLAIYATDLSKPTFNQYIDVSATLGVKLTQFVPSLCKENHKGQLGRIGLLGGSKDFTGAPFFAAMASLRTGADLSYVFTAAEAAPALKSYSPELMVTPVYSGVGLEQAQSQAQAQGQGTYEMGILGALRPSLPRLHALVIGPGLGRDPAVLSAAEAVVREARELCLPLVMDADAIELVIHSKGAAVQGYTRVVLTPNVREFQRLREALGLTSPLLLPRPAKGEEGGEGSSRCSVVEEEEEVAAREAEQLAAELGNVTVVLKGARDIVTNGLKTLVCGVPTGLKRCGGLGDVLAGTMGTMIGWTKQGFEGEQTEEMIILAAWWACAVTKYASLRAYNRKGRSMSATDAVEELGAVMEDLVPSPRVFF
ncbi:unnamed protein product [Discosporangium mesarthrocarpum]